MANPKNTKKETKNQSNGDLAALLRASLEKEEEPAVAPEVKEEDELSRLLREQLERFDTPSTGGSTESSAYGGLSLDEFEEDSEEEMLFVDLPEDSLHEAEKIPEAVQTEMSPEDTVREAWASTETVGQDGSPEEETSPEATPVEETAAEETASEEIVYEEASEEEAPVDPLETGRSFAKAFAQVEESTDGAEDLAEAEAAAEDVTLAEEISEEEAVPAEASTVVEDMPREEEIPAVAAVSAPEDVPTAAEMPRPHREASVATTPEMPPLPQRKAPSFRLQTDEEYDDEELNGRTHAATLDRVMRGTVDEETRNALRRMTAGEGLTPEEGSSTAQTEDPLRETEKEIDAAEIRWAAESKASDFEAPEDTVISEMSAAETVRLPAKKKTDGWHDPLQLTLNTVGSSPKKYVKVPEERSMEATETVDSGAETPSETAEDVRLHGYRVAPAEEARDRDTALYLHLGYEKELESTEEVSHINRVSNQYVKDEYHRRRKGGLRNTPSAVFDGEEYTTSAQTCEKERAYGGATILCKVRIWFTLVFALVGLAFDVLPDFAGLLGDGLVDFIQSPTYPILGLVWLVMSCLPSIVHLAGGLRSLWELKPVAYALPSAAIALNIVYTLAACFLSGQGLRLYIGGSLVILFFACLGDLMKTTAERLSFRVVSSGKAKYILSEAQHDVTEGREEDYVHTYRVRKVERLAHYFLQVTQYDRREWVTGLLICGAFMGGLLVAGATVVAGHGAWIKGLSAFMGTYLAALPGGYLLGLALPLLRANRLIGHHGCAVLTPEATELYAPGKRIENDAVSVTFSSADALKATHVKAVSLSDDGDAEHYRQVANRIFALLSFPLADGSFTLRDRELKGIRLEIAEIDTTCVRLYMIDRQRDLAYEVLLGTHAAMEKRGIKVPAKKREAQYKRTEDSRVLYMAFDRKFRLAYAAEYRPRKSFAQAVKTLGSLGYVLSLVNYDPLVTPELLRSLTTADIPRLDIIRPDHLEESRESRVSGIMATGRATDIVYPITACRRMKTASAQVTRLSWLLMILTVSGLGLGLTLGVMTHVSSLMLCLWQSLWAGGMGLYVRLAMRASRLSITEKKEKRDR